MLKLALPEYYWVRSQQQQKKKKFIKSHTKQQQHTINGHVVFLNEL